jgi:hypothetical protein
VACVCNPSTGEAGARGSRIYFYHREKDSSSLFVKCQGLRQHFVGARITELLGRFTEKRQSMIRIIPTYDLGFLGFFCCFFGGAGV